MLHHMHTCPGALQHQHAELTVVPSIERDLLLQHAGICDDDVGMCHCPPETKHGRRVDPHAPPGSKPLQEGRPMYWCQPKNTANGTGVGCLICSYSFYAHHHVRLVCVHLLLSTWITTCCSMSAHQSLTGLLLAQLARGAALSSHSSHLLVSESEPIMCACACRDQVDLEHPHIRGRARTQRVVQCRQSHPQAL